MSAKIIHVLCEGQTEQGFVEEVLKPYLLLGGITSVKSILVQTNKKLNARGGLVCYHHAKTDLQILMASNRDTEYQRHIFTTMFDLYALPNDFPNYDECARISDRYRRVKSLENAFSLDINSERFIPYIQLHEFESIVFCGLGYLNELYPGCERKCSTLFLDLERIGNPELINDKPATSPSKRIINAIESKQKPLYSYNKPRTGKFIASKVGIGTLRKMCPHLNVWIQQLIDA